MQMITLEIAGVWFDVNYWIGEDKRAHVFNIFTSDTNSDDFSILFNHETIEAIRAQIENTQEDTTDESNG